jgi:hypothetical protein
MLVMFFFIKDAEGCDACYINIRCFFYPENVGGWLAGTLISDLAAQLCVHVAKMAQE